MSKVIPQHFADKNGEFRAIFTIRRCALHERFGNVTARREFLRQLQIVRDLLDDVRIPKTLTDEALDQHPAIEVFAFQLADRGAQGGIVAALAEGLAQGCFNNRPVACIAHQFAAHRPL